MSEFRSRVVEPFLVPVVGLVGAAIFVFAFSRVLLAVPKYWSVTLALLLAAEVLGVGALLSAVKAVDKSQKALVGVLGAVVLVGGGFGMAQGIRPVEKHGSGIEISALGVVFDLDHLNVPAGEEFQLSFENLDAGIPHNVAIYSDDTAAESIYIGAIFNGVETRTYEVPALEEGEYFFRCDVHPNMAGSVTAGGEDAEAH